MSARLPEPASAAESVDRHRRQLLAAALPAAALLASAATTTEVHAKAEPLEPDEDLLFLPSTARDLGNGQLEVDVQIWIHEKNRFKLLDMGLARYLGLKLGDMSPAARLRFAQRTTLFHAEPEEGTVLQIDFGQGTPLVPMPTSDASGRTGLRATVDLKPDARTAPWLVFHARTPGPRPDVEGRALLVPATGLSVISDIDDTIKVTQVRDQQQMLLNTFSRSFKPAPGMAQHYGALARNPQTRFHYLSSSPIQLLPPLQDFLRHEGFPPGSMHLRESTTLRTLIPGEGESRAHKLSAIARLMEDFPQRRFLLVGDSGELDPEIYGDVARRHASRIEGIVIRDVTAEGRDAARYAAAFEGVDPAAWHILRDGQPWPLG
ncbi:phosphatidate phosphatase App1 family protein [Variovorax soli]|uniref:phosphatidate phosphatase App1 family protein n=1 Tax=Variovorax soli TaxID=376815 RepID=UPI000837FFA1|nr:App1 family protein [Variovorax soli]